MHVAIPVGGGGNEYGSLDSSPPPPPAMAFRYNGTTMCVCMYVVCMYVCLHCLLCRDRCLHAREYHRDCIRPLLKLMLTKVFGRSLLQQQQSEEEEEEQQRQQQQQQQQQQEKQQQLQNQAAGARVRPSFVVRSLLHLLLCFELSVDLYEFASGVRVGGNLLWVARKADCSVWLSDENLCWTGLRALWLLHYYFTHGQAVLAHQPSAATTLHLPAPPFKHPSSSSLTATV